MNTHLLSRTLLILLLAAGSVRAAGPDLSAFTHVAPLEPPPPSQGLVAVELTPEIFAAARPDLADLRLINKDGDPVPYVLRLDRGRPDRSVSYPAARLFNPTYVPGKQSTVTVDFANRAPRTRIDIETPGANFRRRVSIEAGQDGETWQVLKASDWLFRINYETGVHNKSYITLPDNDFRYLRLTVFYAPDDPQQVPIERVTAWEIKGAAPQTADVPAKVTVAQDDKRKTTEIDADLGFENMPVCELSFAFSDASFLRRVEVFGRNCRTRTILEPVENSQPRRREIEEPWTSLSVAGIFRLPGGAGQDPSTDLTLPLQGQFRYLLVRIFNSDDAPLKFSELKVRRLRQFVDFQPGNASSFKLYLGHAAAVSPQYDLANFADRLRAQGVTPAKLGALAPNPLFAAPRQTVPWSERNAALLWSSLSVILVILAALVVRQARHARSLAGDARQKQ